MPPGSCRVLVGGQWKRHGQTDTPALPPPGVTRRFPGDPRAKTTGQIWWGSSVKNNGSPAAHESATSVPLAIRRRYWNNTTDVAVPNGPLATAVREDHAAGRLPWVSFKVPVAEWAGAGTGTWDARFDALIAELESYAHPTWLILNHEPENDGGSSANWRAMQSRFRARMNAHGAISKLSFGSCLMTWTWDAASGRNPADWWVDGAWDWHGADHYTEPSAQIIRPAFNSFVSFCNTKGIPFAVPEWGLRAADTNGPTKMQGFYDAMTGGGYDCAALAYWDSDFDGDTDPGWRLTSGLLSKFRALMTDQRSVRLSTIGA